MNVMREYLKVNKIFITNYIKLVLENKYNRKIAEKFYNTYISNRYSLIDEQLGKKNLKVEILKELEDLKKKLILEDKSTKSVVEQIRTFYNYIIYFDNVIHSKNIEKIILQVVETKQETTGKEYPELYDLIYVELKSYYEKITDIINNIQSKQFELEFKKNNIFPEIRKVELKQNIKFPMLYSEYAITKAMQTEPISEDIYFVEYHLLAGTVLNDIINGNVKRQYIVQFPITIINKKQKKQRLLDIINSEFMKYKISFEIDFEDIEKNKEKIYELIGQGYKFAVKIKERNDLKQEDMKRLEIFKYVIIEKNTNINTSKIKSKIIKF